MNIKIGDYTITSDTMQFIVNKKSIVQESRFTKAENVGNETSKVIAYCGKFEQALRYIPQDVLKTNEDISIIMDKLNEIQGDIQVIEQYPVIFIKEEKQSKLDIEEIEKEEVEI